MRLTQKVRFGIVLFLLNCFGYYWLAFKVQRTDHVELFSIFGGLVLTSMLMYRCLPEKHRRSIFWTGLFFRLIFLVAVPKLSDDFYRFTWDGELSRDGYSIFTKTPNDFKQLVDPSDYSKYEKLLNASNADFPNGMNSKDYFSIYPTVNQFTFYTASLVNSPNHGSLIVLRVWILLAEVISFFLLKSLLERHKKDHLVAIYWLHPFVIVELTGNLHFEALAITFILAALYFASKHKWIAAGISVGLGVMTKLTPLFLLIAFFRGMKFKHWLLVSSVASCASVLMFSAIVSWDTLVNFRTSLRLFFDLFAFNSALYYASVDFGLYHQWQDVRETVSLWMPKISAVGMLGFLLFKKMENEKILLLCYTLYFFFSPIVHPWYVTILIPLALLTRTVFPLVWSLLIFGTYFAYGTTGIHAPFAWIYFEYGMVLLTLVLEFSLPKRITAPFLQKIVPERRGDLE